MIVTMLLLMSSTTLLGHPAKGIRHNAEDILKPIIDLLRHNISLPTQEFDDVKHLADSRKGCGRLFFCKVHHLLENQTHDILGKIWRHLTVYNNVKQFRCEAVQDQLGPTGNFIRLPLLKKHLTNCIWFRRARGDLTSTAAPLRNYTTVGIDTKVSQKHVYVG